MGGHEIADWYGISDALGELLPTGEDFDVVVERAGERVVLTVDNPEDGSAEMLGITNTLVTVRLPLGDAIAGTFTAPFLDDDGTLDAENISIASGATNTISGNTKDG